MVVSERDHIIKVGDIFDDWSSNGRAEAMEAGHTPMAKMAFDRLGLALDQTYLDIGCGNGYSVRWAASAGPLVQAIGVDASEEMIARARNLSSDVPGTRFIQTAFPSPILRDETFDAIFSMEAFYYLPDLHDSLTQVRRLLKPGGHFACVVNFYEENPVSHSWPQDLGVEMHLLSEPGWKAALQDAGLHVIEQAILVPENDEETGGHGLGSLMTLAQRPD